MNINDLGVPGVLAQGALGGLLPYSWAGKYRHI